MEFVGFSPGVSQYHRFELDVLKFVQTAQFSQFRVKAAATKLPVFSIYGTVADDIVTRCEPTTAIAIDLLHTPKNFAIATNPARPWKGADRLVVWGRLLSHNLFAG